MERLVTNSNSLSFDGVDDDGNLVNCIKLIRCFKSNNITISNPRVKPNDFNGSQRIFYHGSSGNFSQQYSLGMFQFGKIYFLSGSRKFEKKHLPNNSNIKLEFCQN